MTRDALGGQLVTDPVALNWRHVSSAFTSPTIVANWHVNDSVTSIAQYSLNQHLDLRVTLYTIVLEVHNSRELEGQISRYSKCFLTDDDVTKMSSTIQKSRPRKIRR